MVCARPSVFFINVDHVLCFEPATVFWNVIFKILTASIIGMPKTLASFPTLSGPMPCWHLISITVLMPPYNKIVTLESHSLLYYPVFLKGLMTFSFQYPRPKLVRVSYILTSGCINDGTLTQRHDSRESFVVVLGSCYINSTQLRSGRSCIVCVAP